VVPISWTLKKNPLKRQRKKYIFSTRRRCAAKEPETSYHFRGIPALNLSPHLKKYENRAIYEFLA